MKHILTILFICITVSLHSQTTKDSLICLPITQIIDAATKLKDARIQNKKYENLISELKFYTLQQDTIINNQASIISKKDIEINSYRKALGDYGVQNGKLVWYKNPKVNFVLGVLTGGSPIYIGTRIFTK